MRYLYLGRLLPFVLVDMLSVDFSLMVDSFSFCVCFEVCFFYLIDFFGSFDSISYKMIGFFGSFDTAP